MVDLNLLFFWGGGSRHHLGFRKAVVAYIFAKSLGRPYDAKAVARTAKEVLSLYTVACVSCRVACVSCVVCGVCHVSCRH